MSAPTFGQKCAEAVRDHLGLYGLKQSQLTGAMLAEIIDRAKAFEDKKAKLEKQNGVNESWLKELETEASLAGVNVQAELAKAQFWCKNHNQQLTKRRFVNWLNKADRVITNAGGQQVKTNGFDVYREPEGWQKSYRARTAMRLSEDSWALVVNKGWFELSTSVRKDILLNL